MGPSIEDVGKFSRFLTPTPLCWQFFTTILWQILTPPPKVCRCLKMAGSYVKVMKWQPGIVNDALN